MLGDLAALANSKERISRRFALRIVASLFDPLGWLNPFSLRGKLILQRLWSKGLRWDQEIDNKSRGDIEQWISELEALRDVRLNRCYSLLNKTPASYHLHVYGDASKVAYAAAAYIECLYEDGPSTTSLVMSKSRLAPRDSPTLPRLELLAALIAVRLKCYLVKTMDLKFERTFLYTDSLITYFWVTSTSPGKWKIFVANQVREIQQNSSAAEWNFVPGEHNVADLATRGVSACALTPASAWWEGPNSAALRGSRLASSQAGAATCCHTGGGCAITHQSRSL